MRYFHQKWKIYLYKVINNKNTLNYTIFAQYKRVKYMYAIKYNEALFINRLLRHVYLIDQNECLHCCAISLMISYYRMIHKHFLDKQIVNELNRDNKPYESLAIL